MAVIQLGSEMIVLLNFISTVNIQDPQITSVYSLFDLHDAIGRIEYWQITNSFENEKKVLFSGKNRHRMRF